MCYCLCCNHYLSAFLQLNRVLSACTQALPCCMQSARNDKMRINSQRNLGSAMEQAAVSCISLPHALHAVCYVHRSLHSSHCLVMPQAMHSRPFSIAFSAKGHQQRDRFSAIMKLFQRLLPRSQLSSVECTLVTCLWQRYPPYLFSSGKPKIC